MKNNDNDLVCSCFEYVSNNANSILGNKIAYFREKYRIQHDFSNLNKAIKMIEQASVLSSEEKSFIDSVWSLILVKSNQYTVEGFDFAEINDYALLSCDQLITLFVFPKKMFRLN